MHADFTHGPHFLPEFVRRIDGGADLVVGEGMLQGEPSRGHRMLRRWAPLLLRGRVGVPGVSDVVSGYLALRLGTLRSAIKDVDGPLLRCEGWAANAELIGRLGRQARRIETVPTVERRDLRTRETRLDPWSEARALWQARGALRLPPFARREATAPEREAAELAS
jgi:hypothetical protein